MDENVLEKLEKALDDLSELLDKMEVKTAIEAIPDFIIDPVVEGLIVILNIIQEALDKLKETLDSVGSLEQLLSTINSLLEAAEGLAPGQQETLERVGNIVKTLQDLPGQQEIGAISTKIGTLVIKLGAL